MTQQSPGQPEGPRYERHRRSEKEEEKENEKGRGEKNWDEKWRRDPVNAVSWAAVFIWAGLCLFAENTGWGPATFSWWQTWAVILGGAGTIFVVAALIRLVVPEHRRPITGSLIVGLILIGVAFGEMTDWGFGTIAAFVLIAIGLVIILRGLIRPRR
jgi:hypothetical protein